VAAASAADAKVSISFKAKKRFEILIYERKNHHRLTIVIVCRCKQSFKFLFR
jgi:hypothetical protein